MLRSLYITATFLLVLVPAWVSMASPIQSLVDMERICRFSTLQAGTASANVADVSAAMHEDSGRLFAMPEDYSNDPKRAKSKHTRAKTITSLMEARDYVVERGGVLLRTYTVRFDAQDFELIEDSEHEDLLVLHFPPTVPLFDNEAMVAWTTPTSLSFRVDREDAEEMLALHEQEKLYLEAHVQLAAREAPQRAICRTHQDLPTVEFMLLEGTLHDADDRRPLHHSVTDRYERAACEQYTTDTTADDAPPRVRVTNVSSIGDHSLSHTEGTVLQLIAETDVHVCYMQALRQNSAMRGALVIEFSLSETGHIENSGVVIDATNDRSLTQCTISTLERAEIVREKDASPLNVRVNLTFSR